MDRVHSDSDDEELYSEPTLLRNASSAQPASPAQQGREEGQNESVRRQSSSSPQSTAARSSSLTGTTARSIDSTTLSTLATSTHTTNMSQDEKGRRGSDRAPQHQQHSPPKITILELISDTTTSSALPQPFGFSISRKGRMIAVFSTRNIWLVQADKLPRTFMRTLEVRRKPVAVEITDDGSLLVVLTTPHKVDLYRLQAGEAPGLEKVKSVILTVDAKTIALSPDGLVLACGYQYGIELMSLGEKATECDRRSVNCDPMDHLSFSDDGRTLLATASARLPRPTTVFSVHGAFDGPFTEEGELITPDVDVAWTRQILFPEKAMTAKQALLLPDSTTGQVNELFAFDAEEDSWGIYDLAGTHFAETKLNPPDAGRYMRAEFLEDALPTVSPTADHVAVAVKQSESNAIWLYRLPDSFESDHLAYTSPEKHSMEQSPLLPCARIPVERNEESSSQDITALRWVDSPETGAERLLAVGNIVWNTTPDTPIMPGETAKTSGILIMMDFNFHQKSEAPAPLEKLTVDLDVTLPGERLPDEEITFEREVELVRTRTVAQRRGEATRAVARNSLLRSSTTTSPSSAPRNQNAPHNVESPEDDTRVLFEEPYSHGQPRSQVSLNRAATISAASAANRRHLRTLPNEPLPYRRADGLREIPHESDADNWVPPPPPYTPNADPPGPGAVSISLTGPPAGLTVQSQPSAATQHPPLPRLQIPTAPQNTVTPYFPQSAPAQRNPEPQSAMPSQPVPPLPISHTRSNSQNRYSHPSSNPPMPQQTRNFSGPDRPSTSPPRTRDQYQHPIIHVPVSATVYPSYPQPQPHPQPQFYHPPQPQLQRQPRPQSTQPQLQTHPHPPPRNPEPSAYQATQSNHRHHASPPSPTPQQLAALHRRDSVPTPVPHSALGAVGMNRRAAQSADNLLRPSRRRKDRGRGGLSRLATIRSTNSGRSDGRMGTGRGSGMEFGHGHMDGRVDGRGEEEKERRRTKCLVM